MTPAQANRIRARAQRERIARHLFQRAATARTSDDYDHFWRGWKLVDAVHRLDYAERSVAAYRETIADLTRAPYGRGRVNSAPTTSRRRVELYLEARLNGARADKARADASDAGIRAAAAAQARALDFVLALRLVRSA